MKNLYLKLYQGLEKVIVMQMYRYLSYYFKGLIDEF